MDVLVDKCINFIHKNISAVVGTPGNMTCIRDGLIARYCTHFSISFFVTSSFLEKAGWTVFSLRVRSHEG